MKKRMLGIILALVSVFVCSAITHASEVDSGLCGNQLTWTLDSNGVLTISGTGAMENYKFDSGVYAPWYSYRDSIVAAVMEDGVTTIGNSAFYNCSNLASVTIPESVTVIEWGAFHSCAGLMSVTIPDGVTSIGAVAFFGCSSLPTVTLPDSVSTIGNSAFRRCNSLTSVTIPESVTAMGDYVFQDCSTLSEVTFEGGAPAIGNNAFKNITATVYYPDNNETWTANVKQNYGGDLAWVALPET